MSLWHPRRRFPPEPHASTHEYPGADLVRNLDYLAIRGTTVIDSDRVFKNISRIEQDSLLIRGPDETDTWLPYTDGRVYITAPKRATDGLAGEIVLRIRDIDAGTYVELARLLSDGVLKIKSHFLPFTDGAQDLGDGTTPLRWKDLHLAGKIYAPSTFDIDMETLRFYNKSGVQTRLDLWDFAFITKLGDPDTGTLVISTPNSAISSKVDRIKIPAGDSPVTIDVFEHLRLGANRKLVFDGDWQGLMIDLGEDAPVAKWIGLLPADPGPAWYLAIVDDKGISFRQSSAKDWGTQKVLIDFVNSLVKLDPAYKLFFGDDVVLYRSAENVLKTDDNLEVGGYIHGGEILQYLTGNSAHGVPVGVREGVKINPPGTYPDVIGVDAEANDAGHSNIHFLIWDGRSFFFEKWTGTWPGTLLVKIDSSGNILPGSDGGPSLGSDSLRWATLFARNLDIYAPDVGTPFIQLKGYDPSLVMQRIDDTRDVTFMQKDSAGNILIDIRNGRIRPVYYNALLPYTNGDYDIGSTSYWWNNTYTNRLRLPASHYADKIVLYEGGEETIGTETYTMILTSRNVALRHPTSGSDLFKFNESGVLQMPLDTSKIDFSNTAMPQDFIRFGGPYMVATGKTGYRGFAMYGDQFAIWRRGTADDPNSDTLHLRLDKNGHLLPGSSGNQDLGSDSYKWRDAYIGRDLHVDGEVWAAHPCLHKFSGLYWFNAHWLPPGMLEYDAVGSASIEWDSYSVGLITGTTQGSLARVEKTINLYKATWDKERRICFKILLWQTTAQIIHIVSGGIENFDSIPNTLPHIGYKIVDDTLYATVGDGSAESELNLGAISSGYHELEAVLTPGVECRFFVDGEDKGALSTNLPSGTYRSEDILAASIYNTEAANKRLYIFEVRFLQAG